MARRRNGGGSRQDSPSASFSLDLAPSSDPHLQLPSITDNEAAVQQQDGLLLPKHISVAAASVAAAASSSTAAAKLDQSTEELTQAQRDALGSLGDYAEIDGKPTDAMRYYEVQEKQERLSKEECPVCGETGHDKKGCTHTQCLACGVLDEHSTRDCPMGLVCFRCGTTGHRSRDCKVPRQRSEWSVDCARCGANTHVAKNCPTHWRIYAYNEQHEYDAHRTREAREQERQQALLGGGISSSEDEEDEPDAGSSDMSVSSGDDDVATQRRTSKRKRKGCHPTPRPDWDPALIWCYNCAAHGHHWGDDCPLPRCNLTRVNGEPSAYSHFISITGPFGAALPPPPNSHYQAPPQQHFDFRVGANASMRMTQDPYRNGGGGNGRMPPRAPRHHNDSRQGHSNADRSRRKGERHFDASLDDDDDAEEQDWFAQHTSSNDARRSKAPNRSERRAESTASSSKRKADSQKKRRRAPSPSDSEPDNARGARGDKRASSSKKHGKKTTEAPLAARLAQSQRDKEASRQRQAAKPAPKADAAAELKTREEQSRRDKEMHRRRTEEQDRTLQRSNRRRGEPEFGQFSTDETRGQGGGSSSASHRPLYRGGY